MKKKSIFTVKDLFNPDYSENENFSDADKNQIKKNYQKSCAEVNSKRIFLYVSIIAAFELFLVVFDAIKKDATYSSVQWMYAILNSSMAFISIVLLAITIVYKRQTKKLYKFFGISVSVYSVLVLLCGIADAMIGTVASGRENLTMFFICLMLVSCVLYVNPWVIFASSIFIFNGFEFFTHLTSFSSHHTYAPYPIFIVFITVSASFIRTKQMKENVKQGFQIQKLKKQAEHENELKSQFLANMSHEIRTPMNAIIGMSELAMDFDVDDQEKNLLRQIRSSGNSLVGIINDILDFSKIESGKMEIVPTEYDLVKLMNDIVNVVQVRLSGKDVELKLEIENSLPSIFYGDDMRIRQILINLAGNATKFTDEGSITIRVESDNVVDSGQGALGSGLAIDRDLVALKISVIDTGYGIKQEDLQKLFGAFQQVDMKMNRTKGGTGLGLAISKNLVSLMGGTIGVESEYGKGSNFWISIPQKIVDKKTVFEKYKPLFEATNEGSAMTTIPLSFLRKAEFASLFAEKTENANFVAPNAKILVVDDNEVNLQVADGLLKKLGVNPILVQSGFAALDKIKEQNFDIIFMDHQMPVMDGIETLQKIRANEAIANEAIANEAISSDAETSRHHIVIALSANAVNGARKMFLQNGFDDFVAKPVQGKDFASALQKWLPENLIEIRSKNANGSENENSENSSSSQKIPDDFPLDKIDLSKAGIQNSDIQNAIENAGGFENWLKATKTFISLANKNADDIHFNLACGDWQNYTILVHALKSASRIVGLKELSKNAEELEKLGNKIQGETQTKSPDRKSVV